MIRHLRLLSLALLLAATAASLSACTHDEKKATIEQALRENVDSIPGVTAVDPHVNANTSGTFITLSVTADSYDEAELKSIAREALTEILNDSRIENGSFSMSIFSPDKSINVGPSDLGCADTTGSLDSLRVCFT